MVNRNKFMRIDEETKREIEKLKYEMTALERKRVSEGEIVRRVFRAKDLKLRLLNGSKLRRK